MSKTHVTYSGYLKPNKTITPEVFKPQGLLLCLAQIHSSQCAEFVFASFGDPLEIRTPDPLLKRQLLCQLS